MKGATKSFLCSPTKQVLADRLLSKLTARCRYTNTEASYDFCQSTSTADKLSLFKTDEEHELRLNRKTNLIIYLFAFFILFIAFFLAKLIAGMCK